MDISLLNLLVSVLGMIAMCWIIAREETPLWKQQQRDNKMQPREYGSEPHEQPSAL